MIKNLTFILFLLSLLLCYSCSEDDKPTIIPTGEKVNVKFMANIAPVNTINEPLEDTRATINNLWLLEFDNKGNNVIAYKERIFNLNSPENIELIAGNDMKLIVIANVDDATVFQLGKMNYENAKNAIYTTPVASPEAIPLVGEISGTFNQEGQILETVSLSRIAAKITFSINHNTADGYTLQSVTLKNVAKNMYYFSKGENTQPVITDFQDMNAVTGEEVSYTYCIAENLMGTIPSISSAKDKITDKPATCIEIIGEKSDKNEKTLATFVVFLGENETTDFNIIRNHEYTYNIDVNLADQTDNRISYNNSTVNVAAEANCYMISPNSEQELSIPVARVNRFWATMEGGNVEYALDNGSNGGRVKKWKSRIIWTDTQTPLFTYVKDEGTGANDYIIIKASGSKAVGNALIGIYDATNGEPAQDAKPLWSWHIWVTDYNPGGDINGIIPSINAATGSAAVTGGYVFRFPGLEYNLTINNPINGADQVIMDRNLGATSSDPNQFMSTLGAYYQFGRKDPFIFDTSDLKIPSPNGQTQEVNLKKKIGQVLKAEAVQNPTTFILPIDINEEIISFENADWLKTGSNNDALWYNKDQETTKTLYDPCPAGWRLPYKAETYLYCADHVSAAPNGLYLFGDSGLNIYYPLSGNLNYLNGGIGSFGEIGYFWLGYAFNTKNASAMNIIPMDRIDEDYNPTAIYETGPLTRSCGTPVRCVKE